MKIIMGLEDLKEPVIHGLVGAVISLAVTYGIHAALIPSEDLTWALYAVVFSAFFSAGSSVYSLQEE